jgi:hypothetical protein
MQILDYKAHGIRVLSATVCHGVANQRLCHAFTLLAEPVSSSGTRTTLGFRYVGDR